MSCWIGSQTINRQSNVRIVLYTKVTISELLNESGLLQRDDVLSRRFGRPGLLYSDLLARPDLDDDVMEAGAGDDRLSVVDTKERAPHRASRYLLVIAIRTRKSSMSSSCISSR